MTPRFVAQAARGMESAASRWDCPRVEQLWGISDAGWVPAWHPRAPLCPGRGGEELAQPRRLQSGGATATHRPCF